MTGPPHRHEIERILSVERFRRYTSAARGDIALAIEVYERRKRRYRASD